MKKFLTTGVRIIDIKKEIKIDKRKLNINQEIKKTILNKVIVKKREIIREVITERRERRLKFLKKLTAKRLSINKTTIEIVGRRKREE